MPDYRGDIMITPAQFIENTATYASSCAVEDNVHGYSPLLKSRLRWERNAGLNIGISVQCGSPREPKQLGYFARMSTEARIVSQSIRRVQPRWDLS